MRASHLIAIWLFERLGLDVALTGDLLEECKRGVQRFGIGNKC